MAPRDPGGNAPVRDFIPTRPRVEAASCAWFEEEPRLAVLSTHFNGRADWLRAGQALQRFLLTATITASRPARSPSRWKSATPGWSGIHGRASSTRR